MKHGKKLTRAQKIWLSERRINVDNWLCIEDNRDYIKLIHCNTDTVRILYKGV